MTTSAVLGTLAGAGAPLSPHALLQLKPEPEPAGSSIPLAPSGVEGNSAFAGNSTCGVAQRRCPACATLQPNVDSKFCLECGLQLPSDASSTGDDAARGGAGAAAVSGTDGVVLRPSLPPVTAAYALPLMLHAVPTGADETERARIHQSNWTALATDHLPSRALITDAHSTLDLGGGDAPTTTSAVVAALAERRPTPLPRPCA